MKLKIPPNLSIMNHALVSPVTCPHHNATWRLPATSDLIASKSKTFLLNSLGFGGVVCKYILHIITPTNILPVPQ